MSSSSSAPRSPSGSWLWPRACVTPPPRSGTRGGASPRRTCGRRGGKSPPRAAKAHPLYDKFGSHMRNCSELYEEMLAAGIPPEDARFVLPNATETKIMISMNARELHHFFALRLCRRAPRGEPGGGGGGVTMAPAKGARRRGGAVRGRKQSGEIRMRDFPIAENPARKRLSKTPMLRGVMTMVAMLAIGYRALQYSADEAIDDAEGGKGERDAPGG